MDFETMMALEPHGIDTWVGAGPQYPWGGLYGGQIVAQALRAAAHSVEPQYQPQSLHAYFIRRGDHNKPVRFEVDRIRDGRSFATRAVTARQPSGAIFNMSASFQVPEDAVEVQIAKMPHVPKPDEAREAGWKTDTWSAAFQRCLQVEPQPGETSGWLRMSKPLGDDPVLQACGLAYMSDDLPTDAVASLLPDRLSGEEFHQRYFSASLDHAIWFHRPFDASEWQLQHFVCHGLLSSRGFSQGHVFAGDGTHVATISQEVLFRQLR